MKTLLLAVLLVLAGAGGARAGQTYTGEATLYQDTVWSGEILIDGILTVAPGVTLEIRPGTTVRFTPFDSNGDGIGEHELFIQGTFLALGSAEAPIRFTSAAADPKPGDWGAINMMGAETDNLLRHCLIEYAYRGFHAHFASGRLEDSELARNVRGAQFQESTVTIDRCRIVDNRNGLQFRDSQVRITDTLVSGNYWGVRSLYSDLQLEACLIEKNLINGANLRDSTVTVAGNRLVGNRKGLYLQGCRGRVSDNLLADNDEHGTLLEDSLIDFTGNRVTGNGRAGLRWVDSGGLVSGNDFSGNGEYALVNDGRDGLETVANWWGTGATEALAGLIRDGADRPGLGIVTILSPLSAPPPFVVPSTDFRGSH